MDPAELLPQERMLKAYWHRVRMHLIQTSIWQRYDTGDQPDADYWQALLFQLAGGGDAEGVELALENGANPTKKLAGSWGGAEGGQYVQRISEDAAYRWVKTMRYEADTRVLVWTPMEAAIAGASVECINAIQRTSVDMEKAWAWVSTLAPNLPRIEGAVATLESAGGKQSLPDTEAWLERAEQWIRQRIRHKPSDHEWGRLAQAYRRLRHAAKDSGMKLNAPSEDLTELL